MPAPREEFGPYSVYEQLGVGGMASVHAAETKAPRRRVALKRLLPHAASQEELVDSFVNEARLARYLRHPNVAETFDAGRIGETYFIAMELVAGPNVAQLIRQCKSTTGRIPFPIALNILMQLCDALEYAHTLRDEHGKSLGIIHRDVSPPNVVISNTGYVKLIDFGIAKAKTAHVQTAVGTVKGKFSYMAPEYLSGKLDHRVDLWAVGALAYELLTMRVLFDAGDDFTVLQKVKEMPIEAPSRLNAEIPPELEVVVMTALERNPDRRWQSALAMRTALFDVAAELQTIVTNQQLVQWVEWAFSQEPPGRGSDLSQLIRILETPSRPSAKLASGKTPKPLPHDAKTIALKASPPPAPPVEPKRRMFSTPRVGASMVKAKQGGSARWVLLTLVVLAVLAGAAYAAWYYDLVSV